MNDHLPHLSLSEGAGDWVVLKTGPRCEKRVQGHCQFLDLPVYLPLLNKTHRYGGRVREFTSPLFPGYVFCIMPCDLRLAVLEHRHVVRILEVADQAGLVNQLNSIEKALRSQELVEVMPFLQEGRRATVTSGPLRGVEGIVQRLKGRTRVVMNIDMIQQSVAVEVDAADLAAI